MSYEVKEVISEIKRKREELGLSYKELEKKTGISASTLYRYETMETQIPIDKFQTICKVLNLDIEKLLTSKNIGNKKSIIGTRLKKLRKPSDTNYISLEELAEIFNKEYNLDINKSILAKIENGEHKIKDEILQAYSKYFNVDVNYIKGISNISKEQEAFDDELKEIIEILKFTNKSKYKVLKEILIKINKMDLEKLEAFSKII